MIQPSSGADSPAAEPFAALLEAFGQGRRTALARAISVVEDRSEGFQALMHRLHPRLGGAHRIGITGPPGAGKSTLTAELIRRYRARGERVGVVAVDPTSPFTGGALLGDRVRMNDVGMDAGVFIRSMATRGSLGGLAVTTKEVADVMDAFGFDRLLVETVGVGQSELDIAQAADTTVVVLVPESGDAIQAMKAGLMEISDVFVVNKADRPGAQRLVKDLEMMLHLREGSGPRRRRRPPGASGHHGAAASVVPGSAGGAPGSGPSGPAVAEEGRAGARAGLAPAGPDGGETGPEGIAGGSAQASWEIPVFETIASEGKGIDALAGALDEHWRWLAESGTLAKRRRERLARRVRETVERALARVTWEERGGDAMLAEAMDALEAGETTPYEVSARIVRAALG